MVTGIAGRIGSGKDLVGALIQLYYYRKSREINMNYTPSIDMWLNGEKYSPDYRAFSSEWSIKKYAAKLKQIAAIMTGCRVEDLESQEFKEKNLPAMWNKELAIVNSGSPEVRDSLTLKYTYRKFLQELGTEAIRNNIHQNAWVNALFADYNEKKHNWIITDVRFENDAAAIKERGGIILRVNRGTQQESSHSSETSLDDYRFDHVIDNSGTIDELYQKVSSILSGT